VLCSRSPRRAEILRREGIPFEPGEPPDVDETPPPGLAPDQVALEIAQRKAKRASERHPGRWVLAADTVVALGDDVLGKPADAADALRMLGRLSGRTHRVATGVAVAFTAAAEESFASAVDAAEVTFRPLTLREVRRYVATGEPLDKAGGYGIQGGAAGFVERLEGDVQTVVGLPVRLVRRLLAEAGFPGLSPGVPDGR
jgi:septum formation protein